MRARYAATTAGLLMAWGLVGGGVATANAASVHRVWLQNRSVTLPIVVAAKR